MHKIFTFYPYYYYYESHPAAEGTQCVQYPIHHHDETGELGYRVTAVLQVKKKES